MRDGTDGLRFDEAEVMTEHKDEDRSVLLRRAPRGGRGLGGRFGRSSSRGKSGR